MNTTDLHLLDYTRLATEEDAEIMVCGTPVNLHNYLTVKRINSLLNTEIGIMRDIGDMPTSDCYHSVSKVVIDKLLTRHSYETVEAMVGEFYSRFHEYGSNTHEHFGRSLVDKSFGLSAIENFDSYAFVSINVLGKILQSDDAIEPFLILLQEAILNLMYNKHYNSMEDLWGSFDIPTPTYTDNVVEIGHYK